MTRYLSGLCVAGLGLCGGGWLVVAAVAFGGESAGRAGRVNLLTGAVLIAVSCLSLVCWSRLWRQRLRADGVLADPFPLVSRREARRNRRALSRDVRRAAKLAEQLSALAGRSSPAGQTPATASSPLPPLPQRSRFASELRPRATAAEMAMPRVRPAPMSIPRLAPAADDSAPGPASDGEDAWW